ncbi:hypothetical protein DPMN_017232 [Dreissena polymorpha]|uniref:MAM domain-containing protein n=1 Tax=Dreissena polymorpha TaxID=45954 RepID=A0A9D4NG97_DREPO|nr:hypothetical protein DPMN_017232 [Dreissena polymorpha]
MYGASIGQLNVYQGQGSDGRLLWSLSGDQGTHWRQGSVKLNSQDKFTVRCLRR